MITKATTEYKFISKPWLIQRGRFNDIPEDQVVGLDSLISYDYMGSSEFEWGALPHSLTQITKNWADFIQFRFDALQDVNGDYLYVVCHKTQVDELKDLLPKLFSKDSPCLKEHSGMYDYLSCQDLYSLRTDFWWDVTGEGNINNPYSWMCCFGADHIRKLVIALRKVWVKKETAKGKVDFSDPNFGPQPPVLGIRPRPSELIIDEDWRGQKITVTTTDGFKTVILSHNIQEVRYDPLQLLVKVRTRSGNSKVLTTGPSLKRMALYNILENKAKLNKSQK